MNIKYVGRHPSFTDNIYGTGLVWTRCKTIHAVQDSIGKRFLKHKDSFADCDEPQNTDSTIIMPPEDKSTDSSIIRDSVEQMSEMALGNFAFANFSGYVLDPGLSLDAARHQVKMMLDQFGDASEDAPLLKSEIPVETPVKEPSFKEQVVAMTNAGLKPGEIGKKLGVGHQKVTAVLRNM